MNILYVSPSNAIGGAEMSLLAMTRYFKERGYGVFVALPASKNKLYETLLSPNVDGILHVKPMRWHAAPRGLRVLDKVKQYLYSSYKSRGWHFAPSFAIYRFMKKYRINLVHTNTMFAIDGAFAAKLAAVPHIQHVREIVGLGEHSLAQFPLMNCPSLFRRCMTFLHAKVVANSKFTRETCENYFKGEDFVHIYNSLPESLFATEAQLHSREDERVLTVGLAANVTARWKNHLLFIEIARAFKTRYSSKTICFHIYGNLPHEIDPYLLSLRKTIREYGLEKYVVLKGQHGDVRDLFGEIGVLIHTCSREPFGRVFIEAMAQGVPVVAAKGGGATELIEDGRTGFLVKDDSPEVFAERIDWLLTHPSERQAIVENAYRFALDFKGEKILQQMESLYQEVLASSTA